MLVGSVLDPPYGALVVVIGLFGVVAFGLSGVYASVRALPIIRRETVAGYTTLFSRYLGLWQLDASTGKVLRNPVCASANRDRPG